MLPADPLLIYKIGISLIPGIGPANAKKIIAYLGSIEAVFKEPKSTLEKIPGIGSVTASSIANSQVLDRAKEELEFIAKNKIQPYYILDPNYPNRLRECADAPILFYSRGDVDLNSKKIISIVGTRKATIPGSDYCKKLIKDLVNNGHQPVVVSGLAYGIDITAHKASIDNNLPTVGVMAHGLDKIYPSAHVDIARKMVDNGAIITEFLSNTIPDRQNFIRRNRIVAGLSDATIVIESDLRGGSLITADIANSYNRDVFAVPGRVGEKSSAGCNWLIKTNRAALLESYKDLEYILGWDSGDKNKHIEQKLLFDSLSDEALQILNLLKKEGEMDLDKITMKLKLSLPKTSAILLNLEFDGFVKVLPGKIFMPV
jgi:DNA processing protein